MMPILNNLHYALPEIIVLCTACIALLSDLFIGHKVQQITYWVGLVGLVLAGAACYFLLGNYQSIILGGLYISDDMAQLMKIFITLSVFLSLIYSKTYLTERQMPANDYYVLALFSTLGMMILVSANSLLTVYLGLELLSLPLYAMVAIRRTNGDAAEAAIKYFVMGAIASAMLLYGFSLLYGATGKLQLSEISNAIALDWQSEAAMLSFALVFIVAGLGFKLAAVPFHMWAPDVYQGAPSSVTLFISAAPKIAALAMFMRVLTYGMADILAQWQQILIVVSLLSTGIGNLLAIVQTNIKRLFAYSAISHAGYALFGILAGTTAGYSAALYYILVYALTSVAAFGLIVLLSRNGHEIESIDDFQGLNKRNPWLAFLMMIVLFSMAGVPPTVGFFTKLLVLKALVDVNLTWVAVLGLLFAVIGVYYYIKVVKVMYFEKPKQDDPIKLPMSSTVIYSVNCLSLLYMGIFPSALIAACTAAFAK